MERENFKNNNTNKEYVDPVEELNDLKDEYNSLTSKRKVLKNHESVLKE